MNSSASKIYKDMHNDHYSQEENYSSMFFNFLVAAAAEIDAFLDSHLPMKYHMLPCQVSVPDYFKISLMIIKLTLFQFYVK